MNFFSKTLIVLSLLCVTSVVFGQGATTGAINGHVQDAENQMLPGAVINALHEPTGTRYSAVTREDGKFRIFNVKVGGPYKVSASFTGFKEQVKNNLFVKLGESITLDFTMQLDSVEETLVVVAESNPIINPGRTGQSTNVSTEEITRLPTISRSLSDFTRLSPVFDTVDSDTGAQSSGGANNRYNNIQIDGAVNNDLFGLADTGTPGGQAETQPISIDAIAELQVVTAPFDVRQGGFTGGGVNAVTRSGTNKWEGSVYHFTRDQDMVGDGPEDSPLSEFSDETTGFRVGGPIIKDRAFVFVNAEITRRDQPSDFLIDGSGTDRDFGHVEEAQRFRDILQNTYGYDPGGFGEFIRKTDSDKIFVRFDFNLTESHQLTVRHNFIDAFNDVDRRSNFNFQFPDAQYMFQDETNSTVIQLNSSFGSFFNEARFTYQTIRDSRNGPTRFPSVQVSIPGGTLIAGTEQFSTANSLDQDVIEFTNDLTWFTGDHTLVIGTHNEFFKFDNLFIRDNFGSYRFNSLDDFEQGIASRLDYSYSSDPSDPQKSSKFSVSQLGFYVSDEWAASTNLNITMGLRADIPLMPDDPAANPDVERVFGYATDVNSGGNILWSPRVGFNWDVGGEGKTQVRGGTGVFSGRAPYVWISNQYSNTGIDFTRIRAQPGRNGVEDVIFNPDPDSQPTSLGNVFTSEVNVVDPDLEFPQVWRTNLALDHELPWWGMIATFEGAYSSIIQDVKYSNLNIALTGETAPDGRVLFDDVDRNFGRVILLENTNQGYRWNLTTQLEKPLQDGFMGKLSYTTSRARAPIDGTSSQASSNWRRLENTGDINNPPNSVSDFELRHRFFASISYQHEFFEGSPTLFSAFYNVRSGRPYSNTYISAFEDINDDQEIFTANDLIFVPANEGDVALAEGTTWAELDAYISEDPFLDAARGSIVPRNGSKGPWNQRLDIRISQDIKVGRSKIQVSLDIENFMNLLDDGAGVNRQANFNNHSAINVDGVTDDGRWIYSLERPQRFFIQSLSSRWKAQLGARWTF